MEIFGIQINYWFWSYIILVPILVFSATPKASKTFCIVRIIFAIVLCYLLMNLSVDLKWDLRLANASTEEELERATTDGANVAFTLLFGWIPASLYVGIWYALWRVANRKKPLTINH